MRVAYNNSSLTRLVTPRFEDDTEDQHNQEPEFMYAQILKEILIKMPLVNENKVIMFDFFEPKVGDSIRQRDLFTLFKETYSLETAIHWYTHDSFLYRNVNEALREQNASDLYCMQYCIRLLHDQIATIHASQKFELLAEGTNLVKVFRGMSISDTDFELLKTKRTGDYLSISSFLSTTLAENVAKSFARSTLNIDGMASLLFEIDIDVERCQTPFANIEKLSVLHDEKEILFTMGTIFTIQSIDRDSTGFWRVHVKLTGEEDQKLRTLMKHIERDVHQLKPIFQLARLMEKEGHFDEAIQFYKKLLPEGECPITKPYSDVAAVYGNMGSCYAAKLNKEAAIFYFEEAVETIKTHGGVNDLDLASFYSNLALIYKEQGDEAGRNNIENEKQKLYSKALELLLKALAIAELPQHRGIHQVRLATIFHNLGYIYDDQKKFTKALEMYNKSLDIRKAIFPDTHPDLGYLYNNIAQVFQSFWDEYRAIEDIHLTLDFSEKTMMHFNQTMPKFQKANKILRSSLPSDHPELAVSYNNISMTYYYSGQLKEAIILMEKAKEIYSQPRNRTTHASVLTRITQFISDVKQQQREREIFN